MINNIYNVTQEKIILYLNQFLTALYGSETDEEGWKWADLFESEIEVLAEQFVHVMEFWKTFYIFPDIKTIYQMLLFSEDYYFGGFIGSGGNPFNVPKECFNVAYDFHEYIIEKLGTNNVKTGNLI